MANGLKPKKSTKKNGGPLLGVCTGMIILGTMLTSVGSEVTGVILILAAIVILIFWQLSLRVAAGHTIVRHNAPPVTPPQSVSGMRCPNPELHRHYEASQPAQQQYSAYAESVQSVSPDNQRHLESARRLYEAGLLTSDEFEAEIRRYR